MLSKTPIGAHLPRVTLRTIWLNILPLLLLAACEMQPAETLDTPRVLALSLDPADPSPGAEHTATALTFAVGGELEWALCAEAWAPTEPLSCPSGETALGRGNPLTFTWPDLDSAWLKASAVDGPALPAVKLIEVDAGAINPPTVAIVPASASMLPTLPTSLATKATLELTVDLGDLSDEDKAKHVVSWYVTDGKLEPARTLGTETAVYTAPDAATSQPIRIIAVVRETKGGTAWAEAALEVTP